MKCGLAFWILAPALAMASGGAPPDAGSGDRTPQAIYRLVPEAPRETAGSGLGPLVQARLKIDSRGKVLDVTVTSIEPASRFDALFTRAAEESLSRWRFSPAEKDGRPIEGEASVSIRFQPASAAGSRAERIAVLSLLADDERDARRAQALALPEDQRLQVQEALGRKADVQIPSAKRSEARSDRFVVVTDAQAPDAARKLLENLEAAYTSNLDVFGDRIPPQSPSGPIRAYIYTTKEQYEALISENEGFEWTAGFYNAAGVLAFHLEWPAPEYILVTLIHETTHAFVDRALLRPGAQLPRWLDEGYAEYMGNSDITSGRLVPGSHRKRFSSLRFVPQFGVMFFTSAAKMTAGTAKSALKEERALSLDDILTSKPERFYGVERELFYSQSWLVVHFLRHGRPGWTEVEFPRFMLYVAEGYPPGDAFLRVYGSAPSTFEERYRAYVLDF